MMSISTPFFRRGMGAALLCGGLASASAWGQDRPAADPSNPPAIDLVAPTGMKPASAGSGTTTLAPLDDLKPAEEAAPATADLAAATPPAETGIPDFNAPVEPDTRPVKPVAEGPLHEAFLSPVRDREPEHVPKAPPAPLDERPGVEPTDPGAVWIPGYWVWDAGKQDFVWATGTYRIPPPGRFWVNGYWKRDEQGWTRVPGFWSDRQTDRIDWRKDGPPTTHPPDEVGKSPGEDYFYIPGHYAPDGDGVVWKKGYWAKSQPDWAWVPAQWVRQPEGWTFQEGYWDRTLEDRGTLFAPALVSEEARTTGVTYQPVTQVTPETFGQLYGAFGRPNSYYDGYPGCYFDESGNYYGYANYGNLGTYYGYLDYPYTNYVGANYISTAVGGYGLGYYPGYYGFGGLGIGRFGGGLLGGLFTNLAYGFGSSYYGGFGTGYYPGYLGLGFGGLGYLGGLGYGLGFYPGYGGYGGFGGINRFGYGGRNWYGRNDNHHRPPFYPGHQPGRGPGNWNGNGPGPGNWNGRPGGNRPGFPNQNLVNNAVRNATINTGVVNRLPKQPVPRNTFVNHVGNPSDLSRMLRNPASLPPAASRPYGNAFRGTNTAANTVNRGIAPNHSNWTPGYNGVRRPSPSSSRTAARPAFSSGTNSGPIGRPNGTLSGPMQNSINSFQRGGNTANLGNPNNLNNLRPGNSSNIGRPGPGGNPSQNNFARSGSGSNPLQGFAGGNLNRPQGLPGGNLNRPQGAVGGINRTPGLQGNNLSGLQGLNRSPNAGIGGNPNLGAGRANANPLGGARPNLGASGPRPNINAGGPRPNLGGAGGLGGGALAAPRPTNSFSPRVGAGSNFAGAGSLNRPGGSPMGGMSRPGGGFSGGPAMGGMARPGGGFGGAPSMGGINRGGGGGFAGGRPGGFSGGGFGGGGPRMGGSPGGFGGGGPRMGGGGGGGGRPGGGGGGGGGRR